MHLIAGYQKVTKILVTAVSQILREDFLQRIPKNIVTKVFVVMAMCYFRLAFLVRGLHNCDNNFMKI